MVAENTLYMFFARVTFFFWKRRTMRQTSANKQTKKQAGHTRNANKHTQKQRRTSRGARTRAQNTSTQTHAHTCACECAHKGRHTENRQANKTNTRQRETFWARSHDFKYRTRWLLQSRPAFCAHASMIIRIFVLGDFLGKPQNR